MFVTSRHSEYFGCEGAKSVFKQMRDVAERKKELERQQREVQDRLKEREAALLQSSAGDRQADADAVQALKSTLRELEKKAEVQSLRHEELVLEMAAIKKQSKTKNWIDASPEGTVTPDSFLLFNGSTARSSPLGTAVTPASLEGLNDPPPAAGKYIRARRGAYVAFQRDCLRERRSIAAPLRPDQEVLTTVTRQEGRGSHN
ncbi:hypothetical protein FJT64_027692 [Amphibalanus amphitrite]|uniref:Uncharacterized protein n=1 Tax=Amphibalanus amphitrite TaxID=1232801 RepID=A0A6A4VZL0_AMPAM|nr:hypothetical protein FJT64_027692 [Amphibalanus amphitrite]